MTESLEWLPAGSILSTYREQPEWFGTEYNMNLYRGCSHGCIYCDSRSSCYRVDDFDRVRPKAHALEILEKELGSRRRKGVIASGGMSDPYNPLEKRLRLTAGALELAGRAGFGIGLATKSALITRDIPLYEKIREKAPVLLKISITTLDEDLSGRIEPRVSSPSARLKAVEQLCSAGLFTGILMQPVLPFLEDNAENILAIVRGAGDAGVRFIYPGFGVTLRDNQREWYYERLDEHFPGMSDKYRRFFGERYGCALPKAAALEAFFRKECDSRGILYRMKDIIRAYKTGYEEPDQLELFKKE